MVGTVDATFDPDHVRSMSKMYTTRPGDFVRGEKCFIASPSLGYGDLIAVLEFANA